jgi:CTP-dependent riboflavin kinase
VRERKGDKTLMYYYTKLHKKSRSPSTSKTLVLSYLIQARNLDDIHERLMKLLDVSRMGLWKILKSLRDDGLINEKCELTFKFADCITPPYINVNTNLIKTLGFRQALYISWARSRKHYKKIPYRKVCNETTLKKSSLYRCIEELGDTDLRTENVFTKKGGKAVDLEPKKKQVMQNVREKVKMRNNRTTRMQSIALSYIDACKEEDVERMPFLQSDLYRAESVSRSLNGSIPVEEVVHYMVKNWDSLKSMDGGIRRKPDLPDLGCLSYFFKEIYADIKSKKTEPQIRRVQV